MKASGDDGCWTPEATFVQIDFACASNVLMLSPSNDSRTHLLTMALDATGRPGVEPQQYPAAIPPLKLPWLRETASCMVGRTQLNAAQAFDQ